ncbi:MAG: hypothetical protein ACOCG6_03735 [Candidatus Cloacimonadaceae bacterium]
MYKYFVMFAIILSFGGCNLRENALLPPELNPKDYVESNDILLHANHLVKSSNDDSYLFIPQSSISDSLLHYGDRVELMRTECLGLRDSLAFATDALALSNTYEIRILRGGERIYPDSALNLGTLYTTLLEDNYLEDALLISYSGYLSATARQPIRYSRNRGYFEISASAEQALMHLGNSDSLELTPSHLPCEALLMHNGGAIHFWFPAGYLRSTARIMVSDRLSEADYIQMQALFSAFMLLSPVIEVQTDYQGDLTPLISMELPAKDGSETRWIKTSGSDISAWKSEENTWYFQEGRLLSFLQSAGHYFLLRTMDTQNSLEIALDGSFNQLYLRDLWLDTKGIAVPGLKLKLRLQPNLDDVLNSYFSGKPFYLDSAPEAFEISFWQDALPLSSLPQDLWLELGLKAKEQNFSASRLSRIYRTNDTDILSFKSYGEYYDSQHFSHKDGYIYSGINSSGIYIYGITRENPKAEIPCLKTEAYIQTSQLGISWSDPSLKVEKLSWRFAEALPASHPWLNGNPYTVTNSKALLKIEAFDAAGISDKLPANLLLQLPFAKEPGELINFNPAPEYPKWYRYHLAKSFEDNGFIWENDILQIPLAVPGYLFNTANLNKAAPSQNLQLFKRMIWNEGEYEVYLDSPLPLPPQSKLAVKSMTAFTDSYDILATQYLLNLQTKVYRFAAEGASSFYEQVQPYIRLKQLKRNSPLLFSLSEGEYYRIYPYTKAAVADGWHFAQTKGHVAFYLVHDAEYALVQDLQPHNRIEQRIDAGTKPLILSLYQAQMDIPPNLFGNILPINSKAVLSKASDAPSGALGAYHINFFNAEGQDFQPDFAATAPGTPIPYLYLPVENYSPSMKLRVFYRNLQGQETELNRVESFSENPMDEYIVIGNCVVCFVPGAGIFYSTRHGEG